MKKKAFLVFVLFFSACMTPVYAKAESNPFELPHPTTGEPGVWIPPWVQRLHLETDAKLQTCLEVSKAQATMLAEKEAEISSRIAGTEAVRDALRQTQTQLVSEQIRLSAATASSERRFIWAIVATGVALVTGTILTIDAVF